MDSANIKANLDNTVETVWYQYPLAVRSVLCTFSDPNVIDLQPWNEVYLCALHLLCICSAYLGTAQALTWRLGLIHVIVTFHIIFQISLCR
jgi:hypothetical protein